MSATTGEGTHAKPNYLGIFLTLLALTVVTVLLSRVDLGSAQNAAIAIAVATFKAALVALYFMHLKFEKTLLLLVVLIPLFFLVTLVIGLVPDLMTNAWNGTERDGFDNEAANVAKSATLK